MGNFRPSSSASSSLPSSATSSVPWDLDPRPLSQKPETDFFVIPLSFSEPFSPLFDWSRWYFCSAWLSSSSSFSFLFLCHRLSEPSLSPLFLDRERPCLSSRRPARPETLSCSLSILLRLLVSLSGPFERGSSPWLRSWLDRLLRIDELEWPLRDSRSSTLGDLRGPCPRLSPRAPHPMLPLSSNSGSPHIPCKVLPNILPRTPGEFLG